MCDEDVSDSVESDASLGGLVTSTASEATNQRCKPKLFLIRKRHSSVVFESPVPKQPRLDGPHWSTQNCFAWYSKSNGEELGDDKPKIYAKKSKLNREAKCTATKEIKAWSFISGNSEKLSTSRWFVRRT